MIGIIFFNLESVFLFLSLLPIFKLFVLRVLSEKTIKSNDNNKTLKVVSVEVDDEPPIDLDYFGMLNSFLEEDNYLDTIMLKEFKNERGFLNDNNGVAPSRLSCTIDQGIHAKDLATPTKSIKQYNHDDMDWIQIGKDSNDKFELVLKTSNLNLEEKLYEVFTYEINDAIDELDFIQIGELEKSTEQSSIRSHSNSEHHESPKVRQVQERGFKCFWEVSKSKISNITEQPTINLLVLWILITQVIIPSLYSILDFYLIDDMPMESTFLTHSPIINWSGVIIGTFLFNHHFKHTPI